MDYKMIAVGAVAVVALAAIGLFLMGQSPSSGSQATAAMIETADGVVAETAAEAPMEAPDEAAAEAEAIAHTVEMSEAGFSPSELTIKAGDTVTFLAVDGSGRWPASAFHPTHTAYPGSDIQKCATDEKDMIFDSCGPVAEGQSWSFRFGEKGTWAYHDHDASKFFGKIIVE